MNSRQLRKKKHALRMGVRGEVKTIRKDIGRLKLRQTEFTEDEWSRAIARIVVFDPGDG